MDRRTLITATIAVIGSGVAGCLEARDTMGDSDESGGNDGSTSTTTNDGQIDEHSTICETHFEILDEWDDEEESASVTVEEETVVVTGIIMGRGGCYTARLEDAVIEDETLVVSVESYEDAAEDEGCTGALIFIEYEATVEISGDLPASVRVEHDGEQVTTVQLD